MSGYKTYIIGAAMAIGIPAAHYLGIITTDQAQMFAVALLGAGLASLRHGVSKQGD